MDFQKLRAAGAILLALGTAAILTGCDSGGGDAPASSGSGTGPISGTGSPTAPTPPPTTRTYSG